MINIGILGASGYTGSDLIRLCVAHPDVNISCLVANTHAGKHIGEVFPHLARYDLPKLIKVGEADWTGIDVVFCGLPHGTSEEIIKTLPQSIKVIDMSADFRLNDSNTYAQWYGREHTSPEMLSGAVYGLTEHNRDDIKKASLVACPGCYPTATLMALIPLVQSSIIETNDLIIDAKSGVSGAGRGLKEATHFCEAGEGMSPYGVASHRHAPEIEQEIGKLAGSEVTVNFTPHLVPMSRGELVTIYAKLKTDMTASKAKSVLEKAYKDEQFVQILPEGVVPKTQNVRGSNYCQINIFEDRIKGRVIIIAAIDNLVKGSSGQALQNMNLMFELEENTGLLQAPMFP